MAKKSLGFNIVYQTIYQIFLTITPLITTPFVSRMLGAEGVGSDVTMIVGNGYTKGHAEITLQELRESEALRKIFTELYA